MSVALSNRPARARSALRALVQTRIRMLTRPAATGRGRPPWIRYLILGVVAGVIAFTLSARLADVVGGPAGRLLLAPLLTWVSSAVTVLTFLFAIPAVVATYTYNSDLRLLLLTPLSPRLLIAEKFVALYVQLSALTLLLGIPVLLGVGTTLGLGAGYSVLAVLLLLLLPIAPLALAQLILVVVLRWIPPRWGRTITAVLGSVIAIALYVSSQLLASGAGRQSANLRRLFAGAAGAWWQQLPTTWPGQALAAAGLGQAGTAISYLIAAVVLALALAALAILLVAHLCATGWATYQEVGARRRAMDLGDGAGAAGALPGLPGIAQQPIGVARAALPLRRMWRPLWRKEWRSLRRDPQVLARLLYPLVIVVFGFYRAFNRSATGGVGTSQAATTISFFITVAISLYFLSFFLAPRLVNREGRALPLLAMAPLTARDILLTKWAFGALPIGAIVEIIVIAGAFALHLAPWQALLAMGVYGTLVIAAFGALLTLSLIWPRLDWDNPARQVSAQAAWFSALTGMVLIGGGTTLLLGAIFWSASAERVVAALAIFAVVVVVSAASLVAGTRFMQRLLQGER